jgi:hypothetical protein
MVEGEGGACGPREERRLGAGFSHFLRVVGGSLGEDKQEHDARSGEKKSRQLLPVSAAPSGLLGEKVPSGPRGALLGRGKEKGGKRRVGCALGRGWARGSAWAREGEHGAGGHWAERPGGLGGWHPCDQGWARTLLRGEQPVGRGMGLEAVGGKGGEGALGGPRRERGTEWAERGKEGEKRWATGKSGRAG